LIAGGDADSRSGNLQHDLNTGIWIPDKFDPGALKRLSKLFDGIETRGYRALQAFQPTHGRNRDSGIDSEFLLFPSDERPCGPDLTRDYKHRSPSSRKSRLHSCNTDALQKSFNGIAQPHGFLGQLLGHRADLQGSRARLGRGLIDAGDVGRHQFSPLAASTVLREISLVAAPCSSTAPAIAVAISLTSEMVRPIFPIAETAWLVAP
jgi:hypothetical protein